MSERLVPEERKAQIIQAALELFRKKGYEDTTISNIIDCAGISKGGFYHHYAGKEELLEDIAQLFIGEILAIIREVAKRDDLSPLEKMNAYLRQVNDYKKDSPVEVAALLSELYSGGKNRQLENLIFGYGQEQIAPLMESIIIQGVEEGDFRTDYPEEAAQTYVKLFLIHQREMAEAFVEALAERSEEMIEAIMRKYAFLQKVVEDILGLPEGSLVIEEIAHDAMEQLGREMFSERETS